MKIVDSIMPVNDIRALAANGQKLRVAVTKTSAQGKAAQSTAPNLMSFSTDENSVWFNGKKYGVHLFKDSIYTLSTSSSHQDIVNALNGLDSSNIKRFVDTGVIGVFRLNESPDYYQGIVILGYGEKEPMHIYLYITDNYYNTKYILINVSTPTKYVVEAVEDSSLLREADVTNSLTLTSTTTPLSAAMGKKLQDEKLAKIDVVNNLTTTDTSKVLSAAQGKALNDRINGLGSPYKVKGTKTNISDVLSLTDAKVGDVWNVTNEFTLGGKKYPAGTNVVCVTATSSSDHNDDNWDALGGTVDLTPYLTKSDASNTYAKKTDTNTGFDKIWEQLGVVVTKDEIVNNLTSSETNKPLSAAMGKKLQDGKLDKSDVVDNLTTTSASKALSAAQGKVLNDRISGLGNVYRVKGTKTSLSDVLALIDAKVGDVWNVTNAFTLGSKPYPANTNVVCITATSSSDHDEGNWDPLGGTVNLSTYVLKSDVVDNIVSSDTSKPLSANQGKLLGARLGKLEAKVDLYKLLKSFTSGSLGSKTEVDSLLGTYSTFSSAVTTGKLIYGIYNDSSSLAHAVTFTAYNSTTKKQIIMYAVINPTTMVRISANYEGTNWVTATIEQGALGEGTIIE